MAKVPDFLTVLARTAARRAGARAVEGPDATLTHGQLDALSNQLAHRLRSLGVGRDSRVGISLPRGAGELLALLATSKAGGAYVPLDPSHPTDRLQLIVEDATPQVMVVCPGSPLRRVVGAAQVIELSDVARAGEGFPKTPLPLDHDPEQLAYILFTSGSTGRPKGVEVPRGAFTNFLGSMAHTPGLAEDDRLLAITTTSFDIAGLELFLPLWVGGTVVIADRETVQDARRLRRQLEGSAITAMQATPAAWRLLLEAGWRGDGALRILVGGEALSPALADRLLAAGGELWNMYGPTETTVWSTVERIRPGYDRITIGRPIDETQVYILDAALQPVPAGTEGEIWIGGSGLARGYRGRADLTAERFVQDPHGPAGSRIYRTGDLGRALADGRIECLGRLDHQVKIRGFRVELGEIETALRAVPGVSEALVLADRRGDGDPRLVAYWVGEAGREALIVGAQRKLPTYMVPSVYISIPAFPLNTSGKIDRKQLPLPDGHPREREVVPRPRSDVESRIAEVFGEVLGLADVPVDESFFTLGGTSAMAMEAVMRLGQQTGTEIPVQAIFEAPTVEGMAASIGNSYSPADPIVVRLRRGRGDLPPLFCLFGVNLYQDLARALEGERPVIGMHIPIRYVPGRDRHPTLQAIAQAYVRLVQRHQPHGPYHLLGLCFGGVVAYQVGRALEEMGEKVSLVVVLDVVLPSAVQISRWKRLVSWVRRLDAQGPLVLLSTVRHWLPRLTARWTALRRLCFPAAAGQESVEISANGPGPDAMVARFSEEQWLLASRLLIVRATQEPSPSWMAIRSDYGWSGRASEVVVQEIPAMHTEVLREPHVGSLAQSVRALLTGPEPAVPPRPPPAARPRQQVDGALDLVGVDAVLSFGDPRQEAQALVASGGREVLVRPDEAIGGLQGRHAVAGAEPRDAAS